jgi:hypothetical protein
MPPNGVPSMAAQMPGRSCLHGRHQSPCGWQSRFPAMGTIMGQNRCCQNASFKVLKAASKARNVKLRDVAAAVVDSIAGETPTTHFDD